MKNKISRISPERKMEIKELLEQIRQESYQEGYEDGKVFAAQEAVIRVGLARRSANQQRAELIEKAKKFVNRTIYEHRQLVGLSGNEISFNYAFWNLDFIVDAKKGVVVALLKNQYSKKVTYKGIAKCLPGDVFHEVIGKAISLAKLLKISIPVEFLEAVQPRDVVVGMKIQMANGKPLLLTEPKPKPLFRTEKIIDDTNAQYQVTP